MAAHLWEPSTQEREILCTATTVSEAARGTGRDPATVRKACLRRGSPIPGQTPPPEEADEELEEETGGWDLSSIAAFDDSLWEAFERVHTELDARETEAHDVTIRLPDEAPVLIVFLSDMHIGHRRCAMERLRLDVSLLKATPGARAIFGGDQFDNVTIQKASRGMHHEQLMAIKAQKGLVRSLIRSRGPGKTAAILGGNHDTEWSLAAADYDPNADFAEQAGAPYLGTDGFITFELGDERYRFLVAHSFRMRSSFNATHQAKRLEDFKGDADVVFTGHTHEAAAETVSRRNARHFYGQAGSYMRTSRYSRSLGFNPATHDMPGAILFPDRHEVIGVASCIPYGVHELWSYRRDFACPCARCRPAPERA